MREAVYQALFDLVSSAYPWATASRQLAHWSDVPSEAQPAIFQAQQSEAVEGPHGAGRKWDLRVNLYVYVSRAPNGAPSASGLNAALDALASALGPVNGRPLNLGGLAQWCVINGTIEHFEGTLGDQSVAIVPVQIAVVW